MADYWQIISVTLVCTIKFIIGLAMALAYHFSPITFYLTTVGGGMIGVFVYLYLWDLILVIKKKFVILKPHLDKLKGNKFIIKLSNYLKVFSNSIRLLVKPFLNFILDIKRKFVKPQTHVVHIKINKAMRRRVHFLRTWGSYGIALVTPTIISMPVGTLICRKIEKNKWHIKLVMFVSLSFWSLLVIVLQDYFKLDVQSWIEAFISFFSKIIHFFI